ncbi:MAG: TIGR00730 family Rossman fold protein [Prevotella sp.]|nr:TIGR00730 family Rossman fold protein [Prevotella sp.]
MKIGIFCSANDNIAPIYFEQAAALARWCAVHGHSIVFGGCAIGLMGEIAESFAKEEVSGKGHLIGVVPRIIEQGGRTSPHLTVHIPCDNLSDRKDLMVAQSDVFVALPGGVGTLDEIFTVVSAHTIGYHSKSVLLLNVDGFWNALVALLDDLQERNMIRGHWTNFIRVANSLDELTALLEEY